MVAIVSIAVTYAARDRAQTASSSTERRVAIAVDPTATHLPAPTSAAFYAGQEPAQSDSTRVAIKTASVPVGSTMRVRGIGGTSLVRPRRPGCSPTTSSGAPPATPHVVRSKQASAGTVTSKRRGQLLCPSRPADRSRSAATAASLHARHRLHRRVPVQLPHRQRDAATSDAQVTITINQAPAITSANNATFSIGVPNTFTVTTTGAPPPSITFGACTGAARRRRVRRHNGNGTGTLSVRRPPAPAARTRAHGHREQRHRLARHATVHAQHQPGADHHEREQPHACRRKRRGDFRSPSRRPASHDDRVYADGHAARGRDVPTPARPPLAPPAAGTGGALRNLVFGASNGVAPAARRTSR